jgi:RimJ/RimL family protein N-acetyltransferase
MDVLYVIFESKRVKLNNGKECVLKSPVVEDAEKLIEYLKQISSETDFLTRYPEEVSITLKEEEKFIKELNKSPNNVMISAFIDDRLVGSASINPIGEKIRVLHRATFGIAIIKEAWNLGVGTALITEILDCANKAGYEQVELEVVTQNQRAIKLYERFGFKTYGTRENAFKFKDGSYSSDYLMMKIL